MKKKEQKGRVVVIPENVQKQMESAPQDVKDELERVLQGFVSGEIDPTTAGKQIQRRSRRSCVADGAAQRRCPGCATMMKCTITALRAASLRGCTTRSILLR